MRAGGARQRAPMHDARPCITRAPVHDARARARRARGGAPFGALLPAPSTAPDTTCASRPNWTPPARTGVPLGDEALPETPHPSLTPEPINEDPKPACSPASLSCYDTVPPPPRTEDFKELWKSSDKVGKTFSTRCSGEVARKVPQRG